MNMLDMEIDNECKLKIIIVLLFCIIGYLGIMTGIIAMSLKWGFYTYNHKFDQLHQLLLNKTDNHMVCANNTEDIEELTNTEKEKEKEKEKEHATENINE